MCVGGGGGEGGHSSSEPHMVNYAINPYKPTSLASFFVGHWQTVQNKIRRLIRFSTVCLQEIILKFEYFFF